MPPQNPIDPEVALTTEKLRNGLAPLRWIPTDRHQWHIAIGGRFFAMRGKNTFTVWETGADGLILSEVAHETTREEADRLVLATVVPDGIAERNPMPLHVLKGKVILPLKAQIEALTTERDAWKALAKAERHDAGVRNFGTDADRDAAFARVQEARDALRALGIDPDAKDGAPAASRAIVVTRRFADFHVELEGTNKWAAGKNHYEAIGDLVVHHSEAFGITVKLP
jgi:hypothetical protein